MRSFLLMKRRMFILSIHVLLLILRTEIKADAAPGKAQKSGRGCRCGRVLCTGGRGKQNGRTALIWRLETSIKRISSEILEAYLEEHTADASAVTDIGAVREYEECAWSRARSTRARISRFRTAATSSARIVSFHLCVDASGAESRRMCWLR